MRYEQCKFSCDRSINKRTLLQTKVPIRLHFGFNLADFSDTLQTKKLFSQKHNNIFNNDTLQLAFPTHALQAA